MIDALAPAARALAGGGGAAAVAEAAEAGARATADMAPRAGRASYVPAASCRGLADAGASAVSIFFRAVADAAAPK
jgi:dihydroxyacetone kinase